MSKKITMTTQSKINKMTSSKETTRVGFTTNPERRMNEYKNDGYARSTMYVAPTTNGKQAEQRVLNNQFKSNTNHNNIQKKSNISDKKPGFIYALKKD
jgi:hypothetical protein